MNKEQLIESAKEKMDIARKMEGFVESKEYGIIQRVIEKYIQEALKAWTDKSCAKCSTEKIIENIDKELRGKVSSGLVAADELSKLNS